MNRTKTLGKTLYVYPEIVAERFEALPGQSFMHMAYSNVVVDLDNGLILKNRFIDWEKDKPAQATCLTTHWDLYYSRYITMFFLGFLLGSTYIYFALTCFTGPL